MESEETQPKWEEMRMRNEGGQKDKGREREVHERRRKEILFHFRPKFEELSTEGDG